MVDNLILGTCRLNDMMTLLVNRAIGGCSSVVAIWGGKSGYFGGKPTIIIF